MRKKRRQWKDIPRRSTRLVPRIDVNARVPLLPWAWEYGVDRPIVLNTVPHFARVEHNHVLPARRWLATPHERRMMGGDNAAVPGQSHSLHDWIPWVVTRIEVEFVIPHWLIESRYIAASLDQVMIWMGI